MTLQEAHKTGKKFKRKGDIAWEEHDYDEDQQIYSIGDVYADDWEVEPELYEVNTGIRSVDEISEINDECYARIKIPKVMAHKLEGKRVKATFEVLN